MAEPERYMGSVTVGEKGQIVIPKPIRDMFNIKPGNTLMILADTTRGIAIPSPETSAEIEKMIFKEGEQN